jgi:hypothetical protein
MGVDLRSSAKREKGVDPNFAFSKSSLHVWHCAQVPVQSSICKIMLNKFANLEISRKFKKKDNVKIINKKQHFKTLHH